MATTNYIDALFDPTDDPGWVLMLASAKGRDHINGLFPRAQIQWRNTEEGWPSDWRGFSIKGTAASRPFLFVLWLA